LKESGRKQYQGNTYFKKIEAYKIKTSHGQNKEQLFDGTAIKTKLLYVTLTNVKEIAALRLKQSI